MVVFARNIQTPVIWPPNSPADFIAAIEELIAAANGGVEGDDVIFGLGAAGNTGDVTLAGPFNYLTLAAQIITLGPIDLTTDITGILPLVGGGTGSSTASGARTALGLVIGTDVQAFDATLLSIAALGTAADKMLYTTALDVWAETAITAAGRALLDDASASAQRTTLSAAARSQVEDKNFFVDIQDGDGDYVIMDDIGFGLEIDSLNAVELDAGTVTTVGLKINTTAIGGIGVAGSTTKQTTADPSTSASTMVATDELSVSISGASTSPAPARVSGVIHATRTFD